MNVKEAALSSSFLTTLLALLGTGAVVSGGTSLYKGWKSEQGDFARLKAMREARKRQLALRDEFEPTVRPDIDFLPAPRKNEQKQITFDV